MWRMPQFGVPVNVHFTYFLRLVHNNNSFLWRKGLYASAGINNVAENGGLTQINHEVDSILVQNNCILPTAFPPPATGIVSANIAYVLAGKEGNYLPW